MRTGVGEGGRVATTGLGIASGHSSGAPGPRMPSGWIDRADISAGPGVIHDGGDSAALGDDLLPTQVMFLGAERSSFLCLP